MKKCARFQVVSAIAMVVLVLLAPAALARDPTTIVKEAYQDVLGRDPDPSGLRQFRSLIIDEGWSEEDVRNALRESDEFKNKETDRIIRDAYEDILGRQPDNGGLNQFRRYIKEEGWSEEDVRNALRESEEYKRKNR